MKYKETLFIVDKSSSQSHSFVNGLILGLIIKDSLMSKLIVYKSKSVLPEYNVSNVCISPFKRNLIGKVFGFVYIFFVLMRGDFKRVFIRNEPVPLFMVVLFNNVLKLGCDIDYQTSYPHEKYSGNFLFRRINILIFKYCLKYVKRVFVVSNSAKGRIQSYSSMPINFVTIPLCSDFTPKRPKVKKSNRYLYQGTLNASRELDKVIIAFSKFSKICTDAKLCMIGGTRDDFIEQYPNVIKTVDNLIRCGCLSFDGRLAREDLREVISSFDFGLNVIPVTEQYIESSSTKLGEYISQGTPVISTTGISYHDECHEHDIGFLCDFNTDSIVESLLASSNVGEDDYYRISENCIDFSKEKLNYNRYSTCFT